MTPYRDAGREDCIRGVERRMLPTRSAGRRRAGKLPAPQKPLAAKAAQQDYARGEGGNVKLTTKRGILGRQILSAVGMAVVCLVGAAPARSQAGAPAGQAVPNAK